MTEGYAADWTVEQLEAVEPERAKDRAAELDADPEYGPRWRRVRIAAAGTDVQAGHGGGADTEERLS